MRPTTLIAALSALAVPAFGELAVTSPTASTTCTGGQVCSVKWQDNSQRVSLTQQGNCTIALYAGSTNQQSFLQPIAHPVPINVATTPSIDFTVDPAVGENGKFYFIRFSSVTLKDGANPYLSFSAIFALDGMTGTFNQTVKSQIQGLSSATTGPTSTGATTAVATTRGSSTTSATSRPASASTSASNKNGTGAAFLNASPVTYTGVAAFIGAVVGLFL
jgi:hypothetical protein